MKFFSLLLFLLFFFSIEGNCQNRRDNPYNSIYGQIKINKAISAASVSYERVMLRIESIDFGVVVALNANMYKEDRKPKKVSPSFTLGIMLSEALNEKNRLEAMFAADFYPIISTVSPKLVFLNGRVSYLHYFPKIKTGVRGFIMGNMDIDHETYEENPSLTRRQQTIPVKFYWGLGLAIGKYF